MPFIKHTKYDYPTFKRKLKTNPVWIARAIMLLDQRPDLVRGSSLERAIDVMGFVMALRKSGGVLPWTLDSKHGKDAVKLVMKFAPTLYRLACDKAKQEAANDLA